MQIQHIPLGDINEDAFPRDHSHLGPDTLDGLATSIRSHGLRTPIELAPQANRYALISGFCRLQAYKKLARFSQDYADIPAMIREPDTAATAMLLMVEENAIRAEVAPWDQGRIAVLACNTGTFATLGAAVDTLYQNLAYHKRVELRAIAHMVQALDGLFTEPQSLTKSECLCLAAGIQAGYKDPLVHALENFKSQSPTAQWEAVQDVLSEAKAFAMAS